MKSKSTSFVIALLIAIATYFVAVGSLGTDRVLAVAIALAVFLVAHGGSLAITRSKR